MNRTTVRMIGSKAVSGASLASALFWKSYWTTMRPYLIFVSGAAALTGMAFIPDPDPGRCLLAFIPLFLSYGLGQALTDCFQMDTDTLSSSYRPLVRGIISRKQTLAVSAAGLGAGTLILGALNREILVLGFLAVVGLLLYTKLKRTWWGGPFWNSWIVALLPIMGRLVQNDIRLVAVFRPGALDRPAFSFTLLAIFFAYANFVLMGYLKDISADRKTGYKTFPVVFGWRAAAWGSDAFALAAAGLTAWTLGSLPHRMVVSLAVYAIALIINVRSQIRIHRIRDENRAYGPIAGVVRAFILYSAAITLGLKPQWGIPLVLFYLGFEIALKFRPDERQV